MTEKERTLLRRRLLVLLEMTDDLRGIVDAGGDSELLSVVTGNLDEIDEVVHLMATEFRVFEA